MSLSTRQIRYLRGLSHHLRPIVTVAEKGLTENVLAELEAAFEKHELIKVKLRAAKPLRKNWIEEIGRQCTAESVQAIGQTACFYRRNPEKPIIDLPGEG